MKSVFAIGRHGQFQRLILTGSLVGGLVAACALAAGPVGAQSVKTPVEGLVQTRIQAEINTNEPRLLKGSLHPLAQSRFDAGRMPGNTALQGITIFFNRSGAQETALQALLKAQQDPNSPQFHQWVTPEEFGAQFGMPDADVAKVEGWLESEGFKIESVNRAKTAVHFSGSAAQVERAFATEMHYYSVNGEKHYSASTALSVPAAIAGVVTGVGNLHDFHPHPMHLRGAKKLAKARSQYTYENTDGTEYALFAPGDIKVAYDINSLIGSGNNGTGQVIAIMGQSAIQTTDIENFEQAAGLAVKDPTLTLVPNTGASTLNPGCSGGGSYSCGGDEGESDLDIEWASGTAPGATINFVYTGGTVDSNGVPEFGVFDSYAYAVDNAIGNIISLSYGTCETELDQTSFNTEEQIGEQAAAQGQSVLAASGDQGSTACAGYTDLTTAQQDALAVNYPASSAYVTGVGGTEMTSANATPGSGNPYWQEVPSTSSTGIVLTSALSYIPEVAWNDDSSTYGLSASGGGASKFAARPSWQANVTGIAAGSFRLVPDVSLYSSPNYPGYLFCSSDPSDWFPGDNQGDAPQTASCGATSGTYEFYDNQSGYFTIAGGTSFASPIFAGMLAIVNQAKGYTTGQGLANTELYKLAGNSTTYAAAFHDVKTGNNNCTAGSTYCGSTTTGFSAGTGYDEVTGLGSVDVANLVTAYATSTTTTIGTTTTVTPASTTPTVGANDNITISVSAASGSAAPAGTVTVKIDGVAVTGSPFTLTASGTAATASFTATFATAGAHTITASYTPSGTTFAASSGTGTVTAQASSSGSGTIKVAATPSTLTVSQGSSGTENLTVTGSGGYSGTVTLSIDFGSADSNLGNLCYGFGTLGTAQGTATVSSANGSGSTTLSLSTNAADCLGADAIAASRTRQLHSRQAPNQLKKSLNKLGAQSSSRSLVPEGVAFAGLLVIGFLGRRSRKLRGLVAVLMLATVGMAISACGGSSSNTPSNPPKGTYTGTVTAQDNATATITSTTTFQFVID
jgi:subtilase family serine protease